MPDAAPPPRFAAARFAFGYAALFAITGVTLPWLPVWLESRGLSGEQVGLVIAATMAARFVVAPGAGYVADAWERAKTVLVASAAVLLAAYASAPAAQGAWAYVGVGLLIGAGTAPATPLIESANVRSARRGGPGYGPLRAVGSIAFIAANVVSGALIQRFGVSVVMVWLITAGAAWLVATTLLPTPPRRRARGAPPVRVLADLATPAMALAFAASAAIQASHAFYYGFASLAWREQGFSDTVIGGLWAWAVVVEVALLWFARRIEWLSPPGLLALGAGAAIARWGVMALAPGLAVLIPLQALHAATFGAAHLGFILYVRDRTPEHAAGTAQSLNAAFTFGAAMAGATAVSGVLFDAVGAAGYAAMSVLAGAGLLAAALLIRRDRAALRDHG